MDNNCNFYWACNWQNQQSRTDLRVPRGREQLQQDWRQQDFLSIQPHPETTCSCWFCHQGLDHGWPQDLSNDQEDRSCNQLSCQWVLYMVINYDLPPTPTLTNTIWSRISSPDLGQVYVCPLLVGTEEPLSSSWAPRLRDAVLWINSSSDGRSDDSNLHRGCPVLMGHKWVTNKWISYHDQMFICL